eukprot:3397006-Rhodomonas_salina.1
MWNTAVPHEPQRKASTKQKPQQAMSFPPHPESSSGDSCFALFPKATQGHQHARQHRLQPPGAAQQPKMPCRQSCAGTPAGVNPA